jgi:glycosyltransferase involved in cell wall biosynthesis
MAALGESGTLTEVPIVVPHNRWDLLDPPSLGLWEPTLRLTVVIPYYERPAELARTLHALAAQTYPNELFEVIVVDDGSPSPLVLDDGHLGLDLRVMSQARSGFGAGRARNLGARVAQGSVLVFLDCDMIPEPVHLEAHARWHHLCDHAVTLGPRRHVEVDDLPPDTVGDAARRSTLEQLFQDRPSVTPEWIEGHMERTDELRGNQDDLFRVVTSGNLGVARALFDSCGGFDASFGQWGGEDTELGYRLFTAGGLLVHERQARCWHQGVGDEPDEDEQRSLDEQRARLSHLIAHRGFRRALPGRSFLVPRIAVRVKVSAEDRRAEVVATLEAVLASDVHDLMVAVTVADGHPDRVWLSRQFGDDPRVVLTVADIPPPVPFGVELPAGSVVQPDTLGQVLGHLVDPDDPVGVIRITVPGRRPRDVRATAWSTRALARAGFAGATDHATQLLEAGTLFGERWVSGLDVGLQSGGPSTSDTGASGPDPRRTSPALQSEANELWSLLSRLDDRQRAEVVGTAKTLLGQLSGRQLGLLLFLARRVLGLVLAVAGLRKIRDGRTLRRSLGAIARAMLPARVVRVLRRPR